MPNLPLLVGLSTIAVRGAPRFGAAALALAVAVGTLQATCHLTTGLGKWPTLHDRRLLGVLRQPWLPPLPRPPRTEIYPFDALLGRLVWEDAGRQAVVCVAASATETHGPVTRQGLLHRAIEMKAFPKGLQSVAVFRFGEATAVELLSPDPSTRSTSLPEEEGGLPAGVGRPDRTARGRRGRAAGVGLHRAGPVV